MSKMSDIYKKRLIEKAEAEELEAMEAICDVAPKYKLDNTQSRALFIINILNNAEKFEKVIDNYNEKRITSNALKMYIGNELGTSEINNPIRTGKKIEIVTDEETETVATEESIETEDDYEEHGFLHVYKKPLEGDYITIKEAAELYKVAPCTVNGVLRKDPVTGIKAIEKMEKANLYVRAYIEGEGKGIKHRINGDDFINFWNTRMYQSKEVK